MYINWWCESHIESPYGIKLPAIFRGMVGKQPIYGILWSFQGPLGMVLLNYWLTALQLTWGSTENRLQVTRTCLKCVRSWENCHLGPLISRKKRIVADRFTGLFDFSQAKSAKHPHSLQRLCTSHSWKLPLLPGQRLKENGKLEDDVPIHNVFSWRSSWSSWKSAMKPPSYGTTTRSHETPKHPMDGLRAGGIHCLSVEYHILPSCNVYITMENHHFQ